MARRIGLRGSSPIDPHAYDYLLDLARPAFAWEFARRNNALRRAAFKCRPGMPPAQRMGRNARIYRLRRRFHAAETFGLHYIPDPQLNAVETMPFWLPEALGSAIGLEMAPHPVLQAEHFDIDRLPGAKHLLIPVASGPELVLQCRHYVGYFLLGGRLSLLPRRFFLRVELDAFRRFPEQLNAAEHFYRAVCGHVLGPWRERAFGPERLRRALLAYDIRTMGGGSHWDAARAIYGQDRVEQARRSGDASLRERARRAFAMGKKLVDGGYRNLLH